MSESKYHCVTTALCFSQKHDWGLLPKRVKRVPTNQVCKNLLQSKFLPSPYSLSPPMSHPSRELPLMGGCGWRISKSHRHGYAINKRVLVHFLSSCLTSQRTNIQRNPIGAGFMRNLRTVLSFAFFVKKYVVSMRLSASLLFLGRSI